jgi:hypothetical protein
VFRRPTIEQLEGFIAPTMQALVDGAGTSTIASSRSSTRSRPT